MFIEPKDWTNIFFELKLQMPGKEWIKDQTLKNYTFFFTCPLTCFFFQFHFHILPFQLPPPWASQDLERQRRSLRLLMLLPLILVFCWSPSSLRRLSWWIHRWFLMSNVHRFGTGSFFLGQKAICMYISYLGSILSKRFMSKTMVAKAEHPMLVFKPDRTHEPECSHFM